MARHIRRVSRKYVSEGRRTRNAVVTYTASCHRLPSDSEGDGEPTMRYLLLTTALVVLSPLASAQPNTGNTGNMSQSSRAQTSSTAQAGQGENCGTPDEPKPCPPLPRHPLPYYPANKQ